MNQSSPSSQTSELTASQTPTATQAPVAAEPRPSYVKLALRNMVRKRGTSLKHFGLTAVALLGILIGLSYLTR